MKICFFGKFSSPIFVFKRFPKNLNGSCTYGQNIENLSTPPLNSYTTLYSTLYLEQLYSHVQSYNLLQLYIHVKLYSLASCSQLFVSAKIEGCGNIVSTGNLFPQDTTTISTCILLLKKRFNSSDKLYWKNIISIQNHNTHLSKTKSHKKSVFFSKGGISFSIASF